MQSSRAARGQVSVLFACVMLAAVVRADRPPSYEAVQKAAQDAGITAARALEIAHARVPDGKPLRVELRIINGWARFHVRTLVGDKPRVVKITAADGTAFDVADEAFADDDEQSAFADERRAIADARKTVADAIAAALADTPGTAIDAYIVLANAKPAYKVGILMAEGVMEVFVAADDCKVTSKAQREFPMFVWPFDQLVQGANPLPSGWLATVTNRGTKAGIWRLAPDMDAPSKPNVMKLTTDADEQTFNVLLLDGSSYQDVDLRVMIRADSGERDQGGGVLWRAKDEQNYYVCRLNPLEGNFRVYKVVDGKREQLQTAKFDAQKGVWYKIRVKMIKDRIECFIGDNKLLEATDATFFKPGMIGLWTKSDASTSFDNLGLFPVPKTK